MVRLEREEEEEGVFHNGYGRGYTPQSASHGVHVRQSEDEVLGTPILAAQRVQLWRETVGHPVDPIGNQLTRGSTAIMCLSFAVMCEARGDSSATVCQ